MSEFRMLHNACHRWPCSSDSEPPGFDIEPSVPRCPPSRCRRVRSAATKKRLWELAKASNQQTICATPWESAPYAFGKQQHTVTLSELQDKLNCIECLIVRLHGMQDRRTAGEDAQQQQSDIAVTCHPVSALNPQAPEFRSQQEHVFAGDTQLAEDACGQVSPPSLATSPWEVAASAGRDGQEQSASVLADQGAVDARTAVMMLDMNDMVQAELERIRQNTEKRFVAFEADIEMILNDRSRLATENRELQRKYQSLKDMYLDLCAKS